MAQTTDKRGRKRQHAWATTRENAARAVFTLDMKATICSTSRAHTQPDGRLWNTGSDMRWHKRSEIEGR